MPPTDGMAIGFITSEPRPVAQKMGIKPKMVMEIVWVEGAAKVCSKATEKEFQGAGQSGPVDAVGKETAIGKGESESKLY